MAVVASLSGVGGAQRAFVARDLHELANPPRSGPQRDDRPEEDERELHRRRQPRVASLDVGALVPQDRPQRERVHGLEEARRNHDPRRAEPNDHRPGVLVHEEGAWQAEPGELTRDRPGRSSDAQRVRALTHDAVREPCRHDRVGEEDGRGPTPGRRGVQDFRRRRQIHRHGRQERHDGGRVGQTRCPARGQEEAQRHRGVEADPPGGADAPRE